MAACSADACDREVGPRGARGYCPMHYRRLMRGTDPNFTLRASAEERFCRRFVQGEPDACWEWTGSRDKNGYGNFHADGGHVRASRWAWKRAHGVLPAPDVFVCHRCDNPPCVNPAHLFLGTVVDNNQDAAAKGRTRGNPAPFAHLRRLTPEQVAEIREFGNPYRGARRALAEQYGVTQQHIRAIQIGERR